MRGSRASTVSTLYGFCAEAAAVAALPAAAAACIQFPTACSGQSATANDVGCAAGLLWCRVRINTLSKARYGTLVKQLGGWGWVQDVLQVGGQRATAENGSNDECYQDVVPQALPE